MNKRERERESACEGDMDHNRVSLDLCRLTFSVEH